jgi:hypothetical protein
LNRLGICPGFTDGFERREPIQSLETLGEVVGVEECLDVLAKLVVAAVVVAPNGRLFERTVHPLDLTVRPRMIWLCQPMLNPVRAAEQIEHMGLPARRLKGGCFPDLKSNIQVSGIVL